MNFPVNEYELEKNYDEIMLEIDKLSLKRQDKVWKHWPNFVKHADSWECLRDFHITLFDGLFEFAGKIRKKNISKGGFRFANVIFLEANLPIMLEREFNMRVNWSKISREQYISAMQRSPVNSLELETLLKHSLLKSCELNDKALFISCMSASYGYEKF